MLMDIGVVAAVALVALSIGYAFGARSATSRLHAEQSKSKSTGQDEQRNPPNDVKNDEESDNDEGEVADGDLSSIKAGLLEPCKLVRLTFSCWNVDTRIGILGSCRAHRSWDVTRKGRGAVSFI